MRDADSAALETRIREGIRDYLAHLNDAAYVAQVFEIAGTEAVLGILAEMVQAGERQTTSDALLFALDALRFPGAPAAYGRAFYRSPLLALVREAVYAPDYFTRHQAVHFLGHSGPRSNARWLAAALPWYLVNDPLNLDGLLLELRWLGDRVPLRLRIGMLATAPSFVTRWAAVEWLWDRKLGMGDPGPGRIPAWVRQGLRRLAQDPHPWVRTEAKWRLRQHRRQQGLARLNLPRWKRRWSRALRREGAPAPAFFAVRLSVSNYLAISGESNYDTALVEQVAAYLLANPIPVGYDILAYWRPLATARGRTIALDPGGQATAHL